jgi:lysozyme family protein
MKGNFDRCLLFVLKHEGGWSDDPRDPGGATMKGVTIGVFNEYLGRKATKEELRNISDAQIADIYRTRYWDKARCDDLPPGVDLSVFDLAVNAGPSRAVKILQRCVGAESDGVLGPKTLAAVGKSNTKNLIVRFAEDRRDFYRSLKAFQTFGRGWLRRTDECEKESLQMAGEKP